MEKLLVDIAELVKQFGLATTLCVVLLGFVWWLIRAIRAGSTQVFFWVKPQVERAVESHLKTMDAVCETQSKICDTQVKILSTVGSVADRVNAMDHGEKLDEIHKHVVVLGESDEKTREALEQIVAKLKSDSWKQK